MSSIREMRRTTQTGEAKLDTLPSFTGGTASIRKLREQKLPTQPTVRQTAPKTEQQSQPQGRVRRVEEKYQQITQKRTPQQRLPDVPKPKENPTPGAQGEDWTTNVQRFRENFPMTDGASLQGSQNDDLQFHRKIVA